MLIRNLHGDTLFECHQSFRTETVEYPVAMKVGAIRGCRRLHWWLRFDRCSFAEIRELSRASQLGQTGKELSREGRVRLEWMDYYRRYQDAARTCRHFGISCQSSYRWKRRYDPQHLSTLEGRSRCPHRRRQPTWSVSLADRVLAFPSGARTNSRFCSASSRSRFPLPWWASLR